MSIVFSAVVVFSLFFVNYEVFEESFELSRPRVTNVLQSNYYIVTGVSCECLFGLL
jgi:hypothetical protein